MGVKPEIKSEVNEKVRNLADEWKGKVGSDGENPLEAFGFLLLAGTYGLGDEFSVEKLFILLPLLQCISKLLNCVECSVSAIEFLLNVKMLISSQVIGW
ncbi:hypothetical protein LOK49_LG12G01670 [Camellia lanceoleosa]|uniref:Uncharacterized protein n=1 Tax=Camellia lanceoleosa TaxID=1840588 RepID=A0ACC0FRZ7_9ERIC|nr:hypothetical protein LOK49_LG12G01670 [Camellia lanceoleosa]